MQRALIWLSGADTQILRRCTRMPESERRRFAGLGSTVLIPAALGLVSMGYALSTFTDDWRIVSIGAGLWFAIVLAIDRFLVSTLHKSKVVGNGSFIVAVIFRFLFAALVGIAVSHPLVLGLFDRSISEEIDSNQRRKTDLRIAQIQSAKENAGNSGVARLLASKTETRECLERVLQAEQSGAVQGEVLGSDGRVCGYSSGLPDCGKRCQNVQVQIEALNAEIEQLVPQVQGDLDRVAEATAKDLDNITKNIARDYPARVSALADIEKSAPHVRVVKIFLMVFFTFLDTLLILLKATTPMGEYEEIRDTILIETRVAQLAEREAINGLGMVFHAMAEAERRFKMTRDNAIQLLTITNDFMAAQEHQREVFYQRLKSIARTDAKDSAEPQGHALRAAELRNIFNEAWTKAVARFTEHLQTL